MIPNDFKQTLIDKSQFLISKIDDFASFITFASNCQLEVLAAATTWNCDGTFKTCHASIVTASSFITFKTISS